VLQEFLKGNRCRRGIGWGWWPPGGTRERGRKGKGGIKKEKRGPNWYKKSPDKQGQTSGRGGLGNGK